MLERMRRLMRTEGGQGAIGLVVVVVAVVVSFYLLLRTVRVADRINTKASTIQTGATSIKGDTSVISQLTHTNAIASSSECAWFGILMCASHSPTIRSPMEALHHAGHGTSNKLTPQG